MEQELVTILTERGQTSVPASIRRAAHLEPGQKLHWIQLSATEFRVIVESSKKEVVGPLGALGWARKFSEENSSVSTDEVMKDLREGEEE